MKLLKFIGQIILVLIIIIALWWFVPERTPRINTENGVSVIEYIPIGGVQQCVLIRSHDINNPIMLFLHGGPGMPIMYMAHEFQKPLEKNFTVVQWDRRGAGKSYHRNIPEKESMNVRQLVDDAYDLIDTLRHRYNQDKVILVGHSFGSYLGSIMTTEHPELFYAFISIGQVVDSDLARNIQVDFIREQAIKRNKQDIVLELDQPDDQNLESWLFQFGGELKNRTSFMPFIWTGIMANEYTLREVFNVAPGSSFSSSNMQYNVLDSSIYYEIRNYAIPVYFLVGESDYTTPYELVEQYFSIISAPEKKIIYFENSAHFPFFEEPQKFCDSISELFEVNN